MGVLGPIRGTLADGEGACPRVRRSKPRLYYNANPTIASSPCIPQVALDSLNLIRYELRCCRFVEAVSEAENMIAIVA